MTTAKHPTAEQWLSLEEIAEEIGIPLSSLYQQRVRGQGIPGYKIGRHIRVKRSELDAWLDQRRDDAATRPAPDGAA